MTAELRGDPQAASSALQSETLWTLGRGVGGESLAPNQKSASLSSSFPLPSRISITCWEVRWGKEDHTTAAIDETTDVATELPVSIAVCRAGSRLATTPPSPTATRRGVPPSRAFTTGELPPPTPATA
jgi:hypothetical protein